MDQAKKYISNLPADRTDLVATIHDIITAAEPSLTNKVIWSQLTYGMNDDFHYWVCAISNTKACVKLHFHYGALLDNSEGQFEKTENKFLRSIIIDPHVGLDRTKITSLIRQAVARKPLFVETWQAKDNK